MEFVTPIELKKRIPSAFANFIEKSRETIRNILDRKDPRLLVVVGPCSIHRTDEALEYAEKLKKLAGELKDICYIVMRAYVEKPRTRGGWKGLIHDPGLNGSSDLERGLYEARSFLLNLSQMEMPAATEFLTPQIVPYIEDLISWGCIGARTSSSQVHRLLASHLPMPVGFKNSVDGNIDIAINGVLSATESHHFIDISEHGTLKKVQSKGNPHAHIVLRGGLSETNYDAKTIQETLNELRQFELPPNVLIDCSHDNAERQYFRQKEVFYKVKEQIEEGNRHIIGVMLESNLEASSQTIPPQLSDLQRGISITDGCLDFSSTAELLLSLASISMSLTQS